MQGRFKRDSSAAAEQEPRSGTDRGSSPQHTQNPGPAPSGESGDRAARPGGPTAGDTPAARPKPAGPPEVGSRLALRNWRISTRLVALLTLPVVAATTLGGLRINDSLNEIQQLEHMQLLTELTKTATKLADELQAERDLSAGPLSNNGDPKSFDNQELRKSTDTAKTAFSSAAEDIGNTDGDAALASISSNVKQIETQVGQIDEIRKTAYARSSTSGGALTVDAYGQLIDALLSLSQDMAQATSNPDMIKRTRALAAFSSAKEYASIQRAVIAANLPENPKAKHAFNPNDQQAGLAAQAKYKSALNSFSALYESLGSNADELLAPLSGQNKNTEIEGADRFASRILGNPTDLPGKSYLDWTDQDSVKLQQMKTIEATLLGEMESKARDLREVSQRDAILNGVLILLVLGVSLVGAFIVARSMVRSLRRLQDTATRVAQDRLPELVKQLSESDPQDVDTSVESVGVHSRDEIGKVAAAFDDVHREAVRLAAEQALLRGNVNAMFTNLSRRSQGLIQRQLSLISELESREADPDQLSSLFKLDHLATRMRRNGENLLVLAGEEPGRRWTRPVPLVDVLRAAASEVEQYERIELSAVPATEVAGRVVNDLVHLLAELLENATSFSSPQTKVRVTGHALPDGRVLVEIHDTGIGLSPEDLAAINERLASPPTVDVSVSRRMGLFVVGRLSLRHGIRIQLRPSDSGGTTALVMLPVDVAHGGKKPPTGKPGPGAQNGVGQAPAAPRLGAGPGAADAGRPGLAGPPGGSAAPGRIGAGAPRGQVGAGSSPRAALPSRDGTQGGANGAGQDPQRQDSGQANVFGQNAFGAPAPGQAQGQQPQGQNQGQNQGHGRTDRPGGPLGANGRPGQGQGAGQTGQNGFSGHAQNAFQQGGAPERGRQAPPAGGPRAELPGGNPQQRGTQATSWGTDQPPAQQRSPLDPQRGHEDPHSTGQFARPAAEQQNFTGTGEFPRPDFNAPRPGQNGAPGGAPQDVAATAQFPRPDFNAQPDFSAQPDYNAQQNYSAQPDYRAQPDYNSQQNYAAPPDYRAQSEYNAQQNFNAPQAAQTPPAPAPQAGYAQPQDGADYGAPRQPANLPAQTRQDALPPAGPGDGSTPLFDNLETNWFHGTQQAGGQQQAQQAASQQQPPSSRPPMPQRGSSNGSGGNGSASTNGSSQNGSGQNGSGQNGSGQSGSGAIGASVTSSWRTSPNDELVRQAERVRKPAAGGITTSGLPRRVPRANLVPGTAQEQNNQAGPQVSRAPADVRGRLTNLRRGIQQGRQAGSTGPANSSFNLGPSHQQER